MTWNYNWTCGEPGVPQGPAEPRPGESEARMRLRLTPPPNPWFTVPFHRHTDACVWTDISLEATAGWAALPMRRCQFGGVQDLSKRR